MRFVSPAREDVDASVFSREPLSAWSEFDVLLRGDVWPSIAEIEMMRKRNAGILAERGPRFIEQTPTLLRDGLHYERRIAERGEIATRAQNWHDLINALVWLRHPQLKAALNARQVAEIALVGAKTRSRAQCALTHFDEAGVVVVLRDPKLLAIWDAHDWHALFWRKRDAWRDGSIDVVVFGHALLEHALSPRQLLVGKALAVFASADPVSHVAGAIRAADLLKDPQELRPLPLSGIPGWHADNVEEAFYLEAACFRARRADRRYPPPLEISSAETAPQVVRSTSDDFDQFAAGGPS
jgi:hypothetical protein